MSVLNHSFQSNRLSSFSDSTMSSSSAYSLQLPYLGNIPLGKSPPNLSSFQKPLRELYIPYYRHRRERHYDERRIIISDRDILIFEPDAASKGKRSLIYATLESIVDIQALELYVMFSPNENHHHKRIRAAFLPIGCEHQERFRPLYSTIEKSQYNLLSSPSSSCHPPLVVFVMKKTGTSGTCSLLDCHVFAVHRESIAFDLCDMIRKLIIKRTMSPVLPTSKTTSTTLLKVKDNIKDSTNEKRTKYLNKDRPVSAMEHRNADIQTNNDRKIESNDNNSQLSSSPFHLHANSQVLNPEKEIHSLSSSYPTIIRTLSTKHTQPRHFIKASSSSSSLVVDESEEVVNDLMNIVVEEKLKTIDTNSTQISIKRHASFDQNSSPNDTNDHTMTKKRFHFHNNNNNNNKKRTHQLNSQPLPTILSATNTPILSRTTAAAAPANAEQTSAHLSSIVESHLLRPQIVLNRYGDIGNYVPKLLRDNSDAPIRSSDSNENIFFRATNGHVLNGFLNLDFSSSSTNRNQNNNNNNNNNNNHHHHRYSHYRSSPNLTDENHEQNIFALVKQLRTTQTKIDSESPIVNHTFHLESIDQDRHIAPCRIPRATLQSPPSKPLTAIGGVKVLPSTSHPCQRPLKSSYPSTITKPRRVASFTIADTTSPINYRKYLRQTDQAAHLYGEENQRQQSTTLEHSLGYYP